MRKIVLKINGMSCSRCEQRVKDTLEDLREVDEVKVDLRDKKAEVMLNRDIDDRKLKEIIEDLGYELVKVER